MLSLSPQTLDLLYKMTNPLNVVVITEKLIGYLRQTRDEYIRADLVSKVTQLAERFAPDNIWFIQTMNAIFELGEEREGREGGREGGREIRVRGYKLEGEKEGALVELFLQVMEENGSLQICISEMFL